MDRDTLILVLAVATLVIALAVGVTQYLKAQRAKRTREHSAVTANRPDLRTTTETPGTRGH